MPEKIKIKSTDKLIIESTMMMQKNICSKSVMIVPIFSGVE